MELEAESSGLAQDVGWGGWHWQSARKETSLQAAHTYSENMGQAPSRSGLCRSKSKATPLRA